MPGSIANAVVADVFPSSLYAAFSESRSWEVRENRYRNGELQSSVLTSTSRKGPWRFTARLAPAALATLRTFWEAHGGHTPFQFTPLDGVTRYVRFTSPWSQASGKARTEVTLELIEVT